MNEASRNPAATRLPRNLLGLLGAFLIASLVAGICAAGLIVPAASISGLVSKKTIDAFDALPSDLEETPLLERSKLLAADGSVITTWYDENRDPVPLTKISESMQHAIVAIEDERFYEHGAVDPKGLIRALAVNKVSGGVAQGASTLTQQLVKNQLKENAYAKGDKTALEAAQVQSTARKVKEMRLAAALEKKLSKDQILEKYLNIAWFGGQIDGIQAAAKYYFNTTAAKLTVPQSALLAGMVQSPLQYNPVSKAKAALTRRNTVLDKMLQQKYIDQATHDKAVASKLNPDITPTYAGCANAGTKGYFCDYVYNLITKSNDFKALGKTESERELALERGGYTIKTTLDPKVLDAAWKSVKKRIPPNDKSNVATATVTVQPGTGKVLSMIQNKHYSTKKGQSNTTVNYSVDYKYGGSAGFQTGSTFKPVTLATWLKAGKSLNASIDATKGTLPFSAFKSCGSPLAGTSYTFQNSADGEGEGPTTVWKATADSINGAYVRMESQLDLCDIQDMAAALGMHRAQAVPDPCIAGNLSKKNPKMTTKIPECVPSVTLGIADQSPLTMANAYATFAASGKYCNPIVVTSIKDRNGKAVDIPKADCKQTVDANVANTTTLGLSHIWQGTGAGLGGLGAQPSSAKTGTTNDSQDTWFVGYTPQLATAVWVGPETVNGKRPAMNSITIGGKYYSSVFGASIGGPIWLDVMKSALKDKPVEKFPEGDSKLTTTPSTSVPDVAGKSPDDAKAVLEAAGFQVTAANDPVQSDQPAGTVAYTDPKDKADTGSTITLYISSGQGDGGNQGDGQGNGQGGGQGNGNGQGNGGGNGGRGN